MTCTNFALATCVSLCLFVCSTLRNDFYCTFQKAPKVLVRSTTGGTDPIWWFQASTKPLGKSIPNEQDLRIIANLSGLAENDDFFLVPLQLKYPFLSGKASEPSTAFMAVGTSPWTSRSGTTLVTVSWSIAVQQIHANFGKYKSHIPYSCIYL